jgi:hypothetical protein
MSTYTKQQVIDGRKCGLKYFDKAVELKCRQYIIDHAIEINKEFPDMWEVGWSNFRWAIGNAVREIVNPDKEYPMSWNVDEALDDNEIKFIAEQLEFKGEYTPTWDRKKAKTRV